MIDRTFFIATPLRDGRVHQQYMNGALQAMALCHGSIQFDTAGGDISKARDGLTARFLASEASHLLWVDSDIAWVPDHMLRLFESKLEFVSGCYARKDGSGQLPALALVGGEQKGELLVEMEFVPGGFLMMSRAAVQRMVDAHPELNYRTRQGEVCALWREIFQPLPDGRVEYLSEDISFCRRWRTIGGRIWLHLGVTLPHIGDHTFLPELAEEPKPETAAPAPAPA